MMLAAIFNHYVGQMAVLHLVNGKEGVLSWRTGIG